MLSYWRRKTSIPLTLPAHVLPEYGTRTESIPISAVPVSEMAHDGRRAAVAVPCALQLIMDPLRLPCAVPASLKSFAQVALN